MGALKGLYIIFGMKVSLEQFSKKKTTTHESQSLLHYYLQPLILTLVNVTRYFGQFLGQFVSRNFGNHNTYSIVSLVCAEMMNGFFQSERRMRHRRSLSVYHMILW